MLLFQIITYLGLLELKLSRIHQVRARANRDAKYKNGVETSNRCLPARVMTALNKDAYYKFYMNCHDVFK